MKKILELGDHYVSDFMKPGAEMRETKPWSLDLYLDETIGAVRLDGVAPLDKMYGQYWYRSGTNATTIIAYGQLVLDVVFLDLSIQSPLTNFEDFRRFFALVLSIQDFYQYCLWLHLILS